MNQIYDPLYPIWKKMRYRCNEPENKDFLRYGARGILVCDEWNQSFPAFREWALAAGWRPGLTLDRVDVNGNYEPGNCRWATWAEQANNRRNTRYYEYEGTYMTVREIFDAFQPPVSLLTLRRRLWVGWSVIDAVTIGKNKRGFRNDS